MAIHVDGESPRIKVCGEPPSITVSVVTGSGIPGPPGPPGSPAAYYANVAITQQAWSQGDLILGDPQGSVDAIVITSDDPYIVQVTMTFIATATVVTEATYGNPEFRIDAFLRSLDPTFAGWVWGYAGQTLVAPVQGTLGGLPFSGVVDRVGSILDFDGNQVIRTIEDGDTLAGYVTGLFNAD